MERFSRNSGWKARRTPPAGVLPAFIIFPLTVFTSPRCSAASCHGITSSACRETEHKSVRAKRIVAHLNVALVPVILSFVSKTFYFPFRHSCLQGRSLRDCSNLLEHWSTGVWLLIFFPLLHHSITPRSHAGLVLPLSILTPTQINIDCLFWTSLSSSNLSPLCLKPYAPSLLSLTSSPLLEYVRPRGSGDEGVPPRIFASSWQVGPGAGPPPCRSFSCSCKSSP